jgi:predicted deacylase
LRTAPESYVICEAGGLLEFVVELGDEVRRGQPICRVHNIDRMQDPPRTYAAGCSGRVVGRMHGGIADNGDFLAMVAFGE